MDISGNLQENNVDLPPEPPNVDKLNRSAFITKSLFSESPYKRNYREGRTMDDIDDSENSVDGEAETINNYTVLIPDEKEQEEKNNENYQIQEVQSKISKKLKYKKLKEELENLKYSYAEAIKKLRKYENGNNNENADELFKKSSLRNSKDRYWIIEKETEFIGYFNLIKFYFASIFNNSKNKFRYIQYQGNLALLNKLCERVIYCDIEDLYKVHSTGKKEKTKADFRKEIEQLKPLEYMSMPNDVITKAFHKLDVFIIDHIDFMWLCSAPMKRFLEHYFTIRNNCCALVHYKTRDLPCCYSDSYYDCITKCKNKFGISLYQIGNRIRYKYDTYVEYVDKDNSIYDKMKHRLGYSCVNDEQPSTPTERRGSFLEKKTSSLFEPTYKQEPDILYDIELYFDNCETYEDVMNKRRNDLHNILGELAAMSEFMKTTVDVNDQLLFKVIMLFGNFLILLGEYVWNTTLKKNYV
jgi:hypothetical protein